MTVVLIFVAGVLAADKTIADLKAFQPGPPQLSDLIAFVLPLLIMLLCSFALSDNVPLPIITICPDPCVTVI